MSNWKSAELVRNPYILGAAGVAALASTYLVMTSKSAPKRIDTWESHVKTHSGLMELAEGLWRVTGEGLMGPDWRTMIVYRMKNGGLLIHSAISMRDEQMKELGALGKPEVLVVPSSMHRMDAAVWKERYPKMKVVAPKDCIQEVQKVVLVDSPAEEFFADVEKYGVTVHKPPLVRFHELVYELEISNSESALILTDLLFNYRPPKNVRGLAMWIAGAASDGNQPIQSFGFRFWGAKSRSEMRRFFENLVTRFSGTEKKLIVIAFGHGNPIQGTENCMEKLKKAAILI